MSSSSPNNSFLFGVTTRKTPVYKNQTDRHKAFLSYRFSTLDTSSKVSLHVKSSHFFPPLSFQKTLSNLSHSYFICLFLKHIYHLWKWNYLLILPSISLFRCPYVIRYFSTLWFHLKAWVLERVCQAPLYIASEQGTIDKMLQSADCSPSRALFTTALST